MNPSTKHKELLSLVHLDALELDYSAVRRHSHCDTSPQSRMPLITDRHLRVFPAGSRAFCIQSSEPFAYRAQSLLHTELTFLGVWETWFQAIWLLLCCGIELSWKVTAALPISGAKGL